MYSFHISFVTKKNYLLQDIGSPTRASLSYGVRLGHSVNLVRSRSVGLASVDQVWHGPPYNPYKFRIQDSRKRIAIDLI